MRNRYYVRVERPWNGIDDEFVFKDFTNSVVGESEMRAWIQFLYQDDPDIKVQIIYGQDITSQFIEKGEDEND